MFADENPLPSPLVPEIGAGAIVPPTVETAPTASAPSIASADLAAELATVEASIPGLHDAVGATALASYADASLRADADAALAALAQAQARVAQLTAAIDTAQANEAAAVEAAATAKRQKRKLALQYNWNMLQDKAAKLFGELDADETKLADAEQEKELIAEQYTKANLAVEVFQERVVSLQTRIDNLLDDIEDLEVEIAEFPVTAEQVAAVAAREQAAREAEAEAVEIAAREAEVNAAREAMLERQRAYDSEPIEVVPAFGFYWREDAPLGKAGCGSCPITVARENLPAWQAEQDRLANAFDKRQQAEAVRMAILAKASDRAWLARLHGGQYA